MGSLCDPGHASRQYDHVSRRRRLDLLRDTLAERFLRHGQFISGLEVEPEHRAVAEEAGETQRSLRKNAALAVENVDDPPRGRAQRQRERLGGYFSAFELAPSAPPFCDKNDEDAYREARQRGRDEFCPTGQRTGAVTKAEPDPFAALCASIIR